MPARIHTNCNGALGTARLQGRGFITFVKRQAGDSLRVITRDDRDGVDVLYAREGIEDTALQNRVTAVYQQIAPDGRDRGSDPLDELGEEKAMVQVREEAVILPFPLDDESGVLESLDAYAARDLHGFIMGRVSRLTSEDPG